MTAPSSPRPPSPLPGDAQAPAATPPDLDSTVIVPPPAWLADDNEATRAMPSRKPAPATPPATAASPPVAMPGNASADSPDSTLPGPSGWPSAASGDAEVTLRAGSGAPARSKPVPPEMPPGDVHAPVAMAPNWRATPLPPPVALLNPEPMAAAAPSSAAPAASPSASPSATPAPSAAGPGPDFPRAGTLPGSAQAAVPDTGTRALPANGTPAQPGTLPPASSAPLDGAVRQVGRYQIKSRLGRGGMATVYRAHDPSIGRDVAIKFLHASLCEDDECRMRFLRESRAAGGLAHPNIVVVHDVGEIERRPYMAMELIEGQSLSDLLDAKKTLPVRDAVLITQQLARALEYAHARGIVHRDIKPGNIMLLRGSPTIKVTDFGIAHMDDAIDDQRTLVGAVLGTPQYMSPEQTRGEKLDGRSDLFSAGIVLYQMLVGERPFRGDSLVAVATQIATTDTPSIAGKRAGVPASLRRVVERCLAKQPAQRWQSGRELADALAKVLADLDEAEREQDKPRIVPLRVKWALLMGLIVALVMGLTATVINQRQYAAMMAQVSDYGSALARFIAKQNAAAVLGEDWEAVDIAVQNIMETRNFERISVIDLQGIVRVSSQPTLVGKPYPTDGVESLGQLGGNISALRYQAGGQSVLGFDAPVLFQGKQVGRVALGVPEQPLTQVARLSIVLMAVLALVTVLAVALAMYFLANWFAKPVRLVSDAMAEIGQGRFDHRIAEQRNDEFGQLFKAFDAMAGLLQQRYGAVAAAPSTLAPVTPPAALTPVAPATAAAGPATPGSAQADAQAQAQAYAEAEAETYPGPTSELSDSAFPPTLLQPAPQPSNPAPAQTPPDADATDPPLKR